MHTLHEHYLQACHPAASPHRLRELAQHPDPAIRARVAENVCTPIDVLEALSRDASADVRLSAALNSSAPVGLLWILAGDECPDVRYAIADSPHSAMEILIWLSGDENPYVALRAEKTIETVACDGGNQKGGKEMSAIKVECAFRRALNKRERLNKADATRLKHMVLADGYLSRSERKVMVEAMANNLLDDDAFEIFRDVLLQRHNGCPAYRRIA